MVVVVSSPRLEKLAEFMVISRAGVTSGQLLHAFDPFEACLSLQTDSVWGRRL